MKSEKLEKNSVYPSTENRGHTSISQSETRKLDNETYGVSGYPRDKMDEDLQGNLRFPLDRF